MCSSDLLYHDNMRINIPGLWYMSWYDVLVVPNLEMFNIVRRTARGEAANQQWAIIAPVGHCSYTRATEHTVVGERDMGDARYPYQEMMFAFFDKFLKGVSSPVMDTLPKVRYYTMGMNKWQTSDTWPPRGATPMTFYLSSGGKANTLAGDGVVFDTRHVKSEFDTCQITRHHTGCSSEQTEANQNQRFNRVSLARSMEESRAMQHTGLISVIVVFNYMVV